MLTRIRLDGGNLAYLQLIDLRRMRIDQVVGPADAAAPPRSAYYPAAGSPRFQRLTVDRMQLSCRGRYAAAAFSAVNFAFFESYDPSTALAFPVKVNGRVITGGSGPYGPVAHPKDPYYRSTVLRALTWTDHGVTITPYDIATGAPLSDQDVQNAVVTYAYADHPSYALAGDPPNRYQLLGVVDAAGSPALAVLTLDRASLQVGAQLLRQHGVTGDVLTSPLTEASRPICGQRTTVSWRCRTTMPLGRRPYLTTSASITGEGATSLKTRGRLTALVARARAERAMPQSGLRPARPPVVRPEPRRLER
jgi:hypothetical protein